MGSSKAGALGYTWADGRLWQERFIPSPFITELIRDNESNVNSNNKKFLIRDVSLGEDHTLVLCSNQRDVYAFGKGGDSQLGLVGRPFVSAPVRCTKLSSSEIHAVCAVQSCSITLGAYGNVLNKVGKCRHENVAQGIKECIDRAREQKLIHE